MDVNIPALLNVWQPILWAIGAVLIARIVVVYGISWIMRRVNDPIPFKWQHVLNWGGLRGAICLALVLSLPQSLGPDRELMRAMAFGVVLFTLLIQSTTMGPLIRWLKIITRSEVQVEYELRHARLTALRYADDRLDRMHEDGLLSSQSWEKLKRYITDKASSLAMAVHELLLTDPALETEQMDTAWRELNRAQRASLLSLRRDGVISEDVFEELTSEVDGELSDGTPDMPISGETRTQFLEYTINADSPALGKKIAQLEFPREAIFVSIRRGKEEIIPRGDTILQINDVVTVLCERAIIPEVRNLLV
jgi:CPA1 family monovalent cation:H+ antiporter